ncbi:LPXTG cell wall anchor domain-containing protein [Streptococcus sp. X16XC17]|uniref:LPXTG cell wall anchor domain-containing protein n=1 Tax=unclassified Streptococcus TaxID=2608887 RepID=UPI00103FC1EE|nr:MULTISPECIES: LPXTG cell wall anchor domain-containing protein [unclassified Streptococcus]TCD46523.1 LPXTG cell wall anchor domain-containing protein [Streptococcus sp. X16XC17]
MTYTIKVKTGEGAKNHLYLRLGFGGYYTVKQYVQGGGNPNDNRLDFTEKLTVDLSQQTVQPPVSTEEQIPKEAPKELALPLAPVVTEEEIPPVAPQEPAKLTAPTPTDISTSFETLPSSSLSATATKPTKTNSQKKLPTPNDKVQSQKNKSTAGDMTRTVSVDGPSAKVGALPNTGVKNLPALVWAGVSLLFGVFVTF